MHFHEAYNSCYFYSVWAFLYNAHKFSLRRARSEKEEIHKFSTVLLHFSTTFSFYVVKGLLKGQYTVEYIANNMYSYMKYSLLFNIKGTASCQLSWFNKDKTFQNVAVDFLEVEQT